MLLKQSSEVQSVCCTHCPEIYRGSGNLLARWCKFEGNPGRWTALTAAGAATSQPRVISQLLRRRSAPDGTHASRTGRISCADRSGHPNQRAECHIFRVHHSD